MKKIYLSILISSVLLFNVFIRAFPTHSEVIYPLAASFSIPSFKKGIKKTTDKPTFASFFISSCAAAYSPPSKKAPEVTNDVPTESTAAPTEYNVPLPDGICETTILKGNTSLFGIEINNETDYDLSTCYSPYSIVPEADGPLVLILHTHTSESYRPTADFYYEADDNDRTVDVNFNVARVGKELCDELNRLGIYSVHDETLCDYPSYNGSYKKMLSVAEEALKKNPSVKIVIDLHRDAMIKSDGTKISTVAEIAGEKAAQIMIVVGTDANGLYHPDWRKNFSLAVDLQKAFAEKYPSLARPLNVRTERFNGHISPGEILIEVGTNANTLPEALVSAKAVAEVIRTVTSGS